MRRLTRQIASGLLMASLVITGMGVQKRYASAKILKVSSKKVYIEGIKTKSSVTVTFKSSYGYTKCTVKDKTVCSSSWGKWKGDKITLKLKGLRKGSTTVRVYNTRNREKINIKVYVVKKKPSINATSINIKKKQTYQLKVKNTKYTPKWSSNKKSIATVSNSGLVTGKKDGTCEITAKCNGKKYKCSVKVAGTLPSKATPTPTSTASGAAVTSGAVSETSAPTTVPTETPVATVVPVETPVPVESETPAAETTETPDATTTPVESETPVAETTETPDATTTPVGSETPVA